MSFLLSSYAQKRQTEYVICRNHVPEMPSNSPRTPAVRTVFRKEFTIPLSPVACIRTFVRSSGLAWDGASTFASASVSCT